MLWIISRILAIGLLSTIWSSAEAPKTLSIEVDRTLVEDCSSWPFPAVLIEITNSTDPSDDRFAALSCSPESELPPLTTISVEGRPIYVSASENWITSSQVDTEHGWIVIQKISLPNQSYRLKAESVFPGGRELLSEKTFLVDKVKGSSILTFTIQRRGIIDRIKEKYLGVHEVYISVIVLLCGLLITSFRKQIEKAVDRILDEVGRYSKGKLAARRFLKRYNESLLTTHKYLRLIGFGASGINRPLLEEVFISLRVSPQYQRNTAVKATGGSDLSFEAAVSRFDTLAILGGPGAGKTTILSYIILQCIRGTARSKLGLSKIYLPLFVPLRRLPPRDTSLLDDILNPESQILSNDVLKECPPGFLKKQVERGRCILLLDGLDEVIDDNTHGLVAEKINQFVAQYPRNRYVVTCRLAGWRGLLNNFPVLEAQDFSRNEVHRFIFGWHRAVITQRSRTKLEIDYKSQEEREAQWEKNKSERHDAIDAMSRRLLGAVESSPRLMAIAKNPMLLSLICLVHYVKEILPRDRPVLYEQCLQLLIDAWERTKIDAWALTRNISSSGPTLTTSQKETILRVVALTFQEKGKGEASRMELQQLIEDELRKIGSSISGRDLLLTIEQRSGILAERSIDVIGFSHLTFQEYLVAKHIQLNSAELALVTANFDNQEWREVTLLYAGVIDNASDLIRKMLEIKSPSRWLLAGYTLGEAKTSDRELAQLVLDQLMQQFSTGECVEEALIDALAANAADYQKEPQSPEQQLSAKLVKSVQDRHSSTAAALRVLAKARITKSLPAIVSCLTDPSDTLQKHATESLVLFGNMALPFLSGLIDSSGPGFSLSCMVDVLSRIDTVESAKLLIRCYSVRPSAEDQTTLSIALAKMMRNDVIDTELQFLSERDVPGWMRETSHSDDIIWPTAERAQTGYRRLSLGMRDLIARKLLSSMPNSTNALKDASFKVIFPAIMLLLKTAKDKLSMNQWMTLGFDVTSDSDLTVLERLHKELRTTPSLVSESIKRLLNGYSLAAESSKAIRFVRWPIEVLISALFALDALFLAAMFWVLIDEPRAAKDVYDYVIIAIAGSSILRFVGFSFWSMTFARKGGKLRALANPLPNILRRAPYFTRLSAWANFSLVMLVTFLTSWAAFVVVIILRRLERGIAPDNFGWILEAPALIFLLLCVWFYKYQALKIDAAAILFMRHPQGREMLGLSLPDTPRAAAAVSHVPNLAHALRQGT